MLELEGRLEASQDLCQHFKEKNNELRGRVADLKAQLEASRAEVKDLKRDAMVSKGICEGLRTKVRVLEEKVEAQGKIPYLVETSLKSGQITAMRSHRLQRSQVSSPELADPGPFLFAEGVPQGTICKPSQVSSREQEAGAAIEGRQKAAHPLQGR